MKCWPILSSNDIVHKCWNNNQNEVYIFFILMYRQLQFKCKFKMKENHNEWYVEKKGKSKCL